MVHNVYSKMETPLVHPFIVKVEGDLVVKVDLLPVSVTDHPSTLGPDDRTCILSSFVRGSSDFMNG